MTGPHVAFVYDDEGEPYPEVRSLLTDAYSSLDDEELEGALTEAFPGVTLDDLENFVGTVRNLGRAVAPFVQKGLTGAAKGALSGAVAGPTGIAGGALAGAAGGVLPTAIPAASSRPPTRPGAVEQGPRSMPGGPSPAPSRAGIEVLSKLFDPRTLDALLLLALGTAAKPTVPVGNKRVAPDAFLTLLEQLLGKAARESQSQKGAAVPEYLLGESGEFVCDVASPVERAEVLSELMESESSADDIFAGEDYEQLDDWDEDEFVTEGIADTYSIEEEAESYW